MGAREDMEAGDGITRRRFLGNCAAGAASLAVTPWLTRTAFGAAERAVADGPPPNILIMLADDLGWWSIGDYGDPNRHTPNIDRVAAEGMTFDQAFCTTAICSPCRAELYTGLFPVRNGVMTNAQPFPRAGVRNVFQDLKDRGYRVGLTGKDDHVSRGSFQPLGKEPGLQRFIERSADPFFAVYASTEPHGPWKESDAYDPAKLILPPMLIDTPETRRALADYYAAATRFDDQVGRCMEFLDKAGKAQNTLVLVLSEQGAPFPGGKWTCYDDGVRAGCIARWPGHVKAGSRTQAIVQYADVLPTFIAAAGGDPATLDSGLANGPGGSRGLDGRSFLDVLTGKATEFRDYAFALWGPAEKPEMRAIRDHRWKYIHNVGKNLSFSSLAASAPWTASWRREAKADPKAAALQKRILQPPPEELYDVAADPHELHNLAGVPANRARMDAMRKRLQQWMAEQNDQPGNANPGKETSAGHGGGGD